MIKHTLMHSLLAGALAFSSTYALAETVQGAGLGINFESAQIIGSGNTIHIFRVPVRSEATGITNHFDATFEFTAGSDGTLTFENFRNVQLSPVLPEASTIIVDGLYRDINGAELMIETLGVVNGAVHRRIYEPNVTHPYEGTWIDSNETLDPLNLFSPSVQNTLSTDWVYGTQTSSSQGRFYSVGANNRFALQQMGDRLTITAVNSSGDETDRHLLEKVK